MLDCNSNPGFQIHIPYLMKNINRTIEALRKMCSCQYKKDYVKIIVEARYHLIKVILEIQEHECKKQFTTKEDMLRQIFATNFETKLEEEKINHIRKEWIEQQKHMALLQESLFRKNKLMSLHSHYCSTQGNALSSIIALLMEKNSVPEMFLCKAKKHLLSFIKVCDSSLVSFMKTYAGEVPMEDSTDYRFVLSLYSSVACISNSEHGSLFITHNEKCRKFMVQLIHFLPRIIYSTGRTLKIELLKIIRNLSMNQEGINFLQRCKDLLMAINICIMQEYNAQSFKILLEILERFSKNIFNFQYLNEFSNIINMDRIEQLGNSEYSDVCDISKRIIRNLSQAAEHLKEMEDAINISDIPEKLESKKSESAYRIGNVYSSRSSNYISSKNRNTSSISHSTTTNTSTGTNKVRSLSHSVGHKRYPLSYSVQPTKTPPYSEISNSSTRSNFSNIHSNSSYTSNTSSTSTKFRKRTAQTKIAKNKKQAEKVNTSNTSTSNSNKNSLTKTTLKSTCIRKKYKKTIGRQNIIKKPHSCVRCESEKLRRKSYSSKITHEPKYTSRATSCNFWELKPLSSASGSALSLSSIDYSSPVLVEEIVYVDSPAIDVPKSETTSKPGSQNYSSVRLALPSTSNADKQLIPWSCANRQLIDPFKTRRKNKPPRGTIRIVSRIVDVRPGCQQRVITRVRVPSLHYQKD